MKKKILFLIECMAVGGAEKILIDLVNNMDKEKYDVTVMKVYKNNIYNQSIELSKSFNSEIKMKYMCNNSNKILYRVFNILLNRVNTNLIHKIFIGKKYDIEVAYYEGLPTKLVANSSNKKSTKIAWLHTDTKNRVINYSKEKIDEEKKLYLKYNKIIAVSKDVSKSFQSIFDIKENVIVKHNPIDIEEIRNKSIETINVKRGNELTFITIGRIIPVKGYYRLINSLSKLKNEGFNFKLWMIGDGESREEIEKMVNDNNLKNNVKFMGFQSNPYKYLSKADVYVCSSLIEGYSTVALEAITCEKPIITTNCPGMKEIFNNNECGIICDNNEESLYLSLKKILLDKKLIEYYKSQCKERAKYFNIINTVKEIEEVL